MKETNHISVKEMNHISVKKICVYGICYFTLMAVLITALRGMMDLSAGEVSGEKTSAQFMGPVKIILNNLRNFAGYIILFPIYPVLILFDFVTTGISIAVSISVNGLLYTFKMLAPHGVLEMPNFILYSYISGSLFLRFLKDKKTNIRQMIKNIYGYRYQYALSVILIIVAGIIEGIITPMLG